MIYMNFILLLGTQLCTLEKVGGSWIYSYIYKQSNIVSSREARASPCPIHISACNSQLVQYISHNHSAIRQTTHWYLLYIKLYYSSHQQEYKNTSQYVRLYRDIDGGVYYWTNHINIYIWPRQFNSNLSKNQQGRKLNQNLCDSAQPVTKF